MVWSTDQCQEFSIEKKEVLKLTILGCWDPDAAYGRNLSVGTELTSSVGRGSLGQDADTVGRKC